MTTVIDISENSSAPWLEGIEGSAAHKLIESNEKVIQ